MADGDGAVDWECCTRSGPTVSRIDEKSSKRVSASSSVFFAQDGLPFPAVANRAVFPNAAEMGMRAFHFQACGSRDKIDSATMCSHPAIPGMPMLKRFRRGRRDRGRRSSC